MASSRFWSGSIVEVLGADERFTISRSHEWSNSNSLVCPLGQFVPLGNQEFIEGLAIALKKNLALKYW
jgi:hypothetical protein